MPAPASRQNRTATLLVVDDDGLALCRLLRAQGAAKRLPIIVVSARDDESHKVEAFAAGADDFVAKGAPRGRALLGSNRELGFLADLGRGLLVALEPLQVVRRTAGATYEAANAALCAAMLELRQPGDGEQARAEGGTTS